MMKILIALVSAVAVGVVASTYAEKVSVLVVAVWSGAATFLLVTALLARAEPDRRKPPEECCDGCGGFGRYVIRRTEPSGRIVHDLVTCGRCAGTGNRWPTRSRP